MKINKDIISTDIFFYHTSNCEIGVRQGENFVMLFAVDTIVLAESAEDLQVQLNAFGEYCDN